MLWHITLVIRVVQGRTRRRWVSSFSIISVGTTTWLITWMGFIWRRSSSSISRRRVVAWTSLHVLCRWVIVWVVDLSRIAMLSKRWVSWWWNAMCCMWSRVWWPWWVACGGVGWASIYIFWILCCSWKISPNVRWCSLTWKSKSMIQGQEQTKKEQQQHHWHFPRCFNFFSSPLPSIG